MDEFNTSAALLELYKFVNTYNEELKEALEDDEFAKKNKGATKINSKYSLDEAASSSSSLSQTELKESDQEEPLHSGYPTEPSKGNKKPCIIS